MNARQNLHTWLTAQAALIPSSGDPLSGLAINMDVAEMVGENADKHIGVTLGDASALKIRNSAGVLIDKDGELEIVAYAHVSNADKKNRGAQYQTLELIVAWLEQQFSDDPSAGGALCPSATLGIWRTPKRGDALNSQPYVVYTSQLSYEEP